MSRAGGRAARGQAPARELVLLATCLVFMFASVLAAFTGAPASVSLALFLGALTSVAVGIRCDYNAIDPGHVIVYAWTMSISFYYSGVIAVLRPWYTVEATVYLLAFISCLLAGRALWPALFDRVSPRRVAQEVGFEELWLDFLTFRWLGDAAAVLGYISAVSFAVEMLVFNSIDLSNLAHARAAFVTRNATFLSQVSLIGRVGAIVSLLLGTVFQSRLGRIRCLWYVGSGLSTIVVSVLSAGRFVVLQILMTIMFGLAVRRTFGQRALALARHRVYAVLLGCTLLGYMFYISIARSDRDPFATARYYLASSGLTVGSEATEWGFYRLPIQVQLSVISTFAYSSMPVGHFSIFWNVYDGEPQLGAFNFYVLSHNLKKLDPSLDESTDILAQRYSEFNAVGEGTGTWQTGVRDWIIDFGKPVTIAGAFLIGALGGMTLRKFKRRPRLGTMLRLGGIWMVMLHFPLYSIIGEPSVVAMVLAPWLLPFLRGASRRRSATGLEALRSAIPG